MKIYDTLSETKKELSKPEGELKLFVCGITPYDSAHIGHARTYIAFDIIVRYWRSLGWKIFYLQNITDIDDKIIDRARDKKEDWQSYERKFEKNYHDNEKKLGIISVNKYARATEHIPQIIKQVRTLIDKGYAYKIEGDGYYFDVSKFDDYGKLAKRTVQQAEDGISRIDESSNKRNRGDFALWKFSKPGEPSWDSPIGEGRPGWHIEDTAITEFYFGPQYDVHGGAVDLKFPHHEAEIAQQEAASGKKPLVRFWMHTGFLLANGQKMSKSLNNFVTIDDFLNKYPASALRYLVLSHHYRSPIDYSDNLVAQSIASLNSIQNFVYKLDYVKKHGNGLKDLSESVKKSKNDYRESMDDDFNTSKALASIFELINAIEPVIWDINSESAAKTSAFIVDSLKTLGLNLKNSISVPLKIKYLAHRRESARNNKQFMQSDTLRKKIYELGYSVEDTPLGQFLTKKS